MIRNFSYRLLGFIVSLFIIYVISRSMLWTPLEEEDVRPLPCASFNSSEVALLVGRESVQLPLNVEGAAPLILRYKYSNPRLYQHTTYRTLDIPNVNSNTSLSIIASSVGEYHLISIEEKRHEGQVANITSTCRVVQPQEFSHVIRAFDYKTHDCGRQLVYGKLFTIEFLGTSPYTVEYTVLKRAEHYEEVVTFEKKVFEYHCGSFSYVPTSNGEYIYHILSISDRYYNSQERPVLTIEQAVQSRLYANFKHLSICVGVDQEETLDVNLGGQGPLWLSWEIDSQAGNDTSNSDSYAIKLPRFSELDVGRNYIARLLEVKDAHGCIKEADQLLATIRVRSICPVAYFTDLEDTPPRTFAVVSLHYGTVAKLPLHLRGQAPWQVTFRITDTTGDQSIVHKQFVSKDSFIDIDRSGRYELLNMKDAVGKGKVLGPSYLVQWIRRPTLTISAVESNPARSHVDDGAIVHVLPDICKDAQDAIHIRINGKSPFQFHYTVYRDTFYDYALYRILGLKRHVHIADNEHMYFRLETHKVGTYHYSFDKIADGHFPEPFLLDKVLKIQQTVRDVPTAKFAQPRTEYTVCSLDDQGVGLPSILIQFTGTPPFSINMRVLHEELLKEYPMDLFGIMTYQYELQLSQYIIFNSPGQYHIVIEKVDDAYGCGNNSSSVNKLLPLLSQDKVTIKVQERMDIIKIEENNTSNAICEQDTATFRLKGRESASTICSVHYILNGKHHFVDVEKNNLLLSIPTPKAGKLEIVSTSDMTYQCSTQFKNLTWSIHKLPSYTVARSGMSYNDDYRDNLVPIIINLVGTAPFTFYWQGYERIFDSANKSSRKGKKLEISSYVPTLFDKEYVTNEMFDVWVELYYLKDAYCKTNYFTTTYS